MKKVLRVLRGGQWFKVYYIDEQDLEYHETLDKRDLGRAYYIINGAMIFLERLPHD